MRKKGYESTLNLIFHILIDLNGVGGIHTKYSVGRRQPHKSLAAHRIYPWICCSSHGLWTSLPTGVGSLGTQAPWLGYLKKWTCPSLK